VYSPHHISLRLFQSWVSCHKLESILPCFNGLIDSLTSRRKEWSEYFTNPMSVVNQLPGGSLSLTLFQKCILWRIVQPDRVGYLPSLHDVIGCEATIASHYFLLNHSFKQQLLLYTVLYCNVLCTIIYYILLCIS